jgi:hypothetical protein
MTDLARNTCQEEGQAECKSEKLQLQAHDIRFKWPGYATNPQ